MACLSVSLQRFGAVVDLIQDQLSGVVNLLEYIETPNSSLHEALSRVFYRLADKRIQVFWSNGQKDDLNNHSLLPEYASRSHKGYVYGYTYL
jgi:hypothetical protein